MSRISRWFTYAILTIGALSMLAPLLWMASTALKTPAEIFAYPPRWLPDPARWHNFVDAWQAAPFRRYYLNSLFVAFCVTAGQVTTSALAAYAFA